MMNEMKYLNQQGLGHIKVYLFSNRLLHRHLISWLNNYARWQKMRQCIKKAFDLKHSVAESCGNISLKALGCFSYLA